MKNKISFNVFLLFCFLVFLLSGCQLKENYAMQYGFSNEAATESRLQPKADGLALEIPFADFSCDLKSMKAILERQINNFTLVISGNETTNRCREKFSAEISGIKPGNYWLKVIYRQGDSEKQVLDQPFTVSK